MVNRQLAGRLLLAVGAVGLLVSLLASVVGVRLLGEVEQALDRSLVLTGESLAALDATIAVTEDTIVLLEGTLRQTEATTRDLSTGMADGEDLLDATADLSEHQIADSVAALEEVLPALIETAAVIDRALTALSGVPFGPEYDPAEPFDDSLRTLHGELAGLSDDVRDQAELIRSTGESLGTVRDGTEAIADDLAALGGRLDTAAGLLNDYAATATEARALVDDSQTGLGLQLQLARVLVVVLAATLALGQVVPLGIGWFLLRPEAAAVFLAGSAGLEDPAPPPGPGTG